MSISYLFERQRTELFHLLVHSPVPATAGLSRWKPGPGAQPWLGCGRHGPTGRVLGAEPALRAGHPGIRAAPGCRLGNGAQGPQGLWLCGRPRQSWLRVCSWEAGSRGAEPSARPRGLLQCRRRLLWTQLLARSPSPLWEPCPGLGGRGLPVALTHGAVRGLGPRRLRARGRQRFPGIPEADRPTPGRLQDVRLILL